MATATSTGQNEGKPRLLACGYREIWIPKSGATFPTFLVSLPGQEMPRWRSKRDFLLLGRINSKEKSLPKAALKKLAARSPWRIPEANGGAIDSSKSSTENNYHISMKKNVSQINRFLQEVQTTADGLGDPKVQEAWETFCRPEDTDGLVAPTEATSPLHASDRSRDGSRYGQYFCTRDNANEVIDKAFEKGKARDLIEGGRKILFLEPSCGHGDIVEALVEKLKSERTKDGALSIQGFDIDPYVINKCKAKSFGDVKASISWACQNFLESKRDCPDDTVVMCIGGPPYTTGTGKGADIQTDLPSKFIDHCLSEWKAKAVSFLLPRRYQDIAIDLPKGFKCESFELPSSTFFFQGVGEVKQPSILQCYYLDDD